MKPLLRQTTRPFLIFVLIVLLISIPAYFFVVDATWKNELDEHNRMVALKTESSLNHKNLSDEGLKDAIDFWNRIQSGTRILSVTPEDSKQDSVYTSFENLTSPGDPSVDRFRILSTIIHLNGKPYRLITRTNIEEPNETIFIIALTTFFFMLLLVGGLLYLNKRISGKIWEPFNNTLVKLKSFNLATGQRPVFKRSDIIEFEELNGALDELIEQNISAYRIQKEFTENASHELQTPLSIIKAKLNVLQQSKDLTEEQYDTIEAMNRALMRSTRLNKDLLLLAKIENGQFDNSEEFIPSIIIRQSISNLKSLFIEKNIHIDTQFNSERKILGNAALFEILINNLLLNAFRYSPKGGNILLTLTMERLVISNPGKKSLGKDNLFKRFSNGSSEAKGTGLGLAIVRQIVRYLDWKISYTFENQEHIFSIEF